MRQTTIRFGDRIYQQLERASEETGLPINSIVTVACMEWLETHLPTEATAPRHRQDGSLIERLFGRRQADRFDRFSPDARRALARAEDEARRFAHTAIGPPHLLLALMSELPNVGIDAARLADEVRRVYGQGAEPPPDELGLTAETKRAIEVGVQKARRRGLVQPEHLLLGLLEDAEIRRLLSEIGVELTVTEDAVRRRLANDTGDSAHG